MQICNLTYARLQGLGSLIEHFQNSKVLNHKDKKYQPIIREFSSIDTLIQHQKASTSVEMSWAWSFFNGSSKSGGTGTPIEVDGFLFGEIKHNVVFMAVRIFLLWAIRRGIAPKSSRSNRRQASSSLSAQNQSLSTGRKGGSRAINIITFSRTSKPTATGSASRSTSPSLTQRRSTRNQSVLFETLRRYDILR